MSHRSFFVQGPLRFEDRRNGLSRLLLASAWCLQLMKTAKATVAQSA